MGPEVLFALQVAGAAVSAIGAISQGNAAKAAADREAQIFERNAQLTAETAKFEEARLRERAERLRGRQRAIAGAQGTAFEGSPSLLAEELAADTELDALAIRFSATESMVRSRAAAASRLEGKAARTAGFFRASSSVLTGGLDLIPSSPPAEKFGD